MIKVGDVFKTNKGGDCVVVEYVNYDNIIVEFCDEYKYNIKVKGCQLKNGNIKNPLSPSTVWCRLLRSWSSQV